MLSDAERKAIAEWKEYERQRDEATAKGVIPPPYVRYHWTGTDYRIMADKLDDAGYPLVAMVFREATDEWY